MPWDCLGVPFAVIARPLDNPALDRRLIELRGGTGNAVIPKRRAVRETMKALARGSGVAILIDQDAREGWRLRALLRKARVDDAHPRVAGAAHRAPIIPRVRAGQRGRYNRDRHRGGSTRGRRPRS
jgi:hypothetical protein